MLYSASPGGGRHPISPQESSRPCPTSSPSISAAPSPISSPAMSRPARSPTPRARRPTVKLGDAIFDCIRKAALDARDASFVKHGTTLVINALLQRAGAKTALLTTKGFRDMLEIGRGNRTQPFNLRFHREPPLVPRELRFEVDGAGGRLGPGAHAAGDRASSAPLAETLRSQQVEALAISFLNSYLTPDHEQAAAAELRRLLPGRLRHHRHRADPRVARVRAHRDRGGQRLCRAAGQQIHRRVRRRPAQRRLQRLAAADGLARRRDFGRARLPRADHAGGIRAGRRLHRRRELRPAARRRQSRRLRHGRHHREMRHDRARPLCGGIDLSHRRPRCRLPDPRQRHRHPRGRRRRRLDRLARRPAPAQRRAAQRRLDAGPGLLRPRRRRADRHRRQSAARPARSGQFPRRRDAARRRQRPRRAERARSPGRSATAARTR